MEKELDGFKDKLNNMNLITRKAPCGYETVILAGKRIYAKGTNEPAFSEIEFVLERYSSRLIAKTRHEWWNNLVMGLYKLGEDEAAEKINSLEERCNEQGEALIRRREKEELIEKKYETVCKRLEEFGEAMTASAKLFYAWRKPKGKLAELIKELKDEK